MTMSWADIVEKSSRTKDDIKAELDLAYVCATELGIIFDGNSANCPFHADEGLNFTLWGEAFDRWGCWVCGDKGDVFDLLQIVHKCSFPEAIQRASKLLEQQAGEDLSTLGIDRQPMYQISAETLRITALAAYNNALDDPTPIEKFVATKQLSVSVDDLIHVWHVGVSSYVGTGTILIPHLRVDRKLVGYKVRTATTPTISAKGSRFTALYGEWNDAGRSGVVLCEGETDTWAAWVATGRSREVFGLPTGAAATPRDEWVARLSGRDVTIIFDPDDAGVRASAQWRNRLKAVASVRVIDLPEGTDCATISTSELQGFIG